LYAPKPMHIPDGFLSVPVAVAMWLISIIVLAYALKRASKDLGERQVPLMGVLAACIFAGQMLNFAVAGGTSGHLLGAALAAILLGPWAAVLVLTTVVSVQALIFQDGGLLALGANIFNMAVVGVFVASFAYRSMQRLVGRSRWGVPVSGFVAGWLSVLIAALATALELALSGTSPANIAIPAMGGIYALIGVGEGLLTAGALTVIAAARPDLLRQGQAQAAHGGRAVWLGGLIIALGLAVASPLASTHPDGLAWVAGQNGFLDAARGPVFKIIPNYILPGVPNQTLATILAGVIGALVVAGVALAVAYTRRSRRPEAE
jgi:cobalt/nickel transport system permease protein